jgi:hypothetical protein
MMNGNHVIPFAVWCWRNGKRRKLLTPNEDGFIGRHNQVRQAFDNELSPELLVGTAGRPVCACRTLLPVGT